MMKKTFLILIASISAAGILRAEAVSESRARDVAARFMGPGVTSLIWNGCDRHKSSETEPPFYVFGNPDGGWVIVAGDDIAVPVLAYGEKGTFDPDGMPENLRWWLSTVSREISTARSKGAVTGAAAGWDSSPDQPKSSGGRYLQTAEWSQFKPYNNYCPNILEYGKSVKTLSGCVATAAAIVMRYNKWPAHGNGTLENYVYKTTFDEEFVKINGYDISGHRYDYDNMPLSDAAVQRTSTEKQQAIAQFIYDVAVMVQASFNYEAGTGAYSANIIPALCDHMYYSRKATEKYRSNFRLVDWISMLRDEIDGDRPLIYGGTGTDGGHEFVICGYDAADRFYVNWGWGGEYNGYYAIRYLSADKYNYSDNQCAIFGLVPDEEGTDTARPYLTLEPLADLGDGIDITQGEFVSGGTLKLAVKYIWNGGTVPYNGNVRAGIVDIKGNLKEFIGDNYKVSLKCPDGFNYYTEVKSYTCNVNCEPVPGDAIRMFYELDSGEWVPMDYSCDSAGYHGEYPAYDACRIRTYEALCDGDPLVFDLIPGQKKIQRIVWYYDGEVNTLGQTVLHSGEHVLEAEVSFIDGSRETLVKEFVVD